MLKIVKPRKTKLIRWTFHIFALIRFQGTEKQIKTLQKIDTFQTS